MKIKELIPLMLSLVGNLMNVGALIIELIPKLSKK